VIAFRVPTIDELWCVRMHNECIPVLFRRDPFNPQRVTAIYDRVRQRTCIACRDDHDPGDEDPTG
jgi:hypothetical protein